MGNIRKNTWDFEVSECLDTYTLYARFPKVILNRQGSHSGHYRPSLERVHVPMGSRRACCQVIRPFANGIQVLIQVAWGFDSGAKYEKRRKTRWFLCFFPKWGWFS